MLELPHKGAAREGCWRRVAAWREHMTKGRNNPNPSTPRGTDIHHSSSHARPRTPLTDGLRPSSKQRDPMWRTDACEQADMTLHSLSTCVLGVGYLSSGNGSRNKHSPRRSQQGRHAKKKEGDSRPDPQQGPQRDTGRGAAAGATKNKADCTTIPLSPKRRRHEFFQFFFFAEIWDQKHIENLLNL